MPRFAAALFGKKDARFMGKLVKLRYHRLSAWTQTSLRIDVVIPKPSSFTHIKDLRSDIIILMNFKPLNH